MNHGRPIRRPLTRLLLLVAVMFAFGVVLVPLYDAMRNALGINVKTSDQYKDADLVDQGRLVRVQFLSANNADMSWTFYPKAQEINVHPGAVNEMLFVAQNSTDKTMTAQAVPSISPGKAAVYFHKTECFCFTQQILHPGERVELPVRFIVDRDLPPDVKQLTLSYTLFDITPRLPLVAGGVVLSTAKNDIGISDF